ncbi:MAG: efflux RND transporter periplasmic adaptor subunit [Myxococcota bacterium]
MKCPIPACLLLFPLACASEPEAGPRERPPALVSVSRVEAGTVEQQWSYLGQVRAAARAEVAAGADGAVTLLKIREGASIKKGEVLLEVDPALAAAGRDVARAELAQTEERLAQAERDLARVAGLGERAVSASEVERAESLVTTLKGELRSRQAAERRARAEYLRQLVRAPFDGVVARRLVDPGDWVNVGTPVLELVSTAQPDVIVDVSEELVGSLSVGMPVQLRGRQVLTANVAAFVPVLDPLARTARVRIALSEAPSWLLAGGTVNVTFDVAALEDGVVVPRDAVIESQTGARLVKVVDGKAQAVTVRVLARATERLLVTGEGLAVGDAVVIRGNERLRPGQDVKVADESSAAGAPAGSVAAPGADPESRGG